MRRRPLAGLLRPPAELYFRFARSDGKRAVGRLSWGRERGLRGGGRRRDHHRNPGIPSGRRICSVWMTRCATSPTGRRALGALVDHRGRGSPIRRARGGDSRAGRDRGSIVLRDLPRRCWRWSATSALCARCGSTPSPVNSRWPSSASDGRWPLPDASDEPAHRDSLSFARPPAPTRYMCARLYCASGSPNVDAAYWNNSRARSGSGRTSLSGNAGQAVDANRDEGARHRASVARVRAHPRRNPERAG